jgi:AcrR family transcriptional regulator
MGRRIEQVAKQRQNILETSLELFVQKGYHGTTVRDIAQKAEISVGLLFHYFPTKEAILQEIIALSEQGMAVMLEILASPKNPLLIFEQIAQTIFESLTEPQTRYIFLLVNQVITFESIPYHDQQIQRTQETIQASIPVILKGQEQHVFKTGAPLALAVAFWGAIQGIAETLLWFPNNAVPDYHCVVDMLKA